VNLYDEDIKFFEKKFGYGWSVELRRIMRREIVNYKAREEMNEMSLSRAHRGDYS
jgi:hypothetical protein